MATVVFLIPARAGSRGIPGKNLCLVGGLPLLVRAVRTALDAARRLGVPPENVLVSTDSSEMAALAKEWGAQAPFLRPPNLATDDATTVDVALHALDFLQEGGLVPDRLVLLQATSPLNEPEDVVGAVRLSERTGASVVTVRRESHPVEWAQRRSPDGRLVPAVPSDPVRRRQEAPPAYRVTGAVYVTSVDQLRTRRSFVVESTRGLEIPDDRALDVDGHVDLSLADALLDDRRPAPIRVGHRLVGPGQPCFLIAEAGVNHGGSLERAIALVDAAHAAGADAVKFQLYRPEEQVTREAPTADYQRQGTRSSTMLEMARSYELPWEAHREIVAHCREVGIPYMASCFESAAVDFLLSLGGDCVKVGSGEITNFPLLRHIARTGRPILLSTGMSTLRDVAWAVDEIRRHGESPVALFHCVSSYPTDPATANLRAMRTLARAFNVPVGFSDHTLGREVAVVAASLGAAMIEKHLTLDKNLEGPDHAMSCSPSELADLIRAVRTAEAALGSGAKEPVQSELSIARVARRSLVSARAIAAGERLDDGNVTLKRPATGIDPRRWEQARGREAAVDIQADVPITWDMLR